MSDTAAPWSQRFQDKVFFQGWHPFNTDILTVGFADAGGVGVVRLPAFPDLKLISKRLSKIYQSKSKDSHIALDIRGVLGEIPTCLDSVINNLTCFLIHEYGMLPERLELLKTLKIPRIVVVNDSKEAVEAKNNGAIAIIVKEGADLLERVKYIITASSLPCVAPVYNNVEYGMELLARGVSGLQLRSPSLLKTSAVEVISKFRHKLSYALGSINYEKIIEKSTKSLQSLKIRNIEVPYPIIQGGMGVGISWENLAGNVAKNGCIGIISALATGYRHPELIKTIKGRPYQSENIHSTEILDKIIKNALLIAKGQGAIGVNIMCAITEYENMVRQSVKSGAQLIISGAGLPLSLPSYVEDSNIALVPIVSSARALKIICKSWERKFNRLPDAVILEGPESGGHQGFSLEECTNSSITLNSLLPSIITERDLWGNFPIIAAGGIWDRHDIDHIMSIGADGVQMATRFIGTFECDAHINFKKIILQADKTDIALHESPVGMPARGVITTNLHGYIKKNIAPKIKCISNCITPCEHGKGAIKAGYCIMDRLADAMNGNYNLGLFFTGSNGWKLQDYIHVRELIGEITEDYGLSKLLINC